MFEIWKELRMYFEVKKYIKDHHYMPKLLTIPAEYTADVMLYVYKRNNERLRYMLENLKAMNKELERYTKKES